LWEWISSNVETFRAVQAASKSPQLMTEETIL